MAADDIYLHGLCGNGSDGGLFWSWGSILETDRPSLPVCFQYSVWVWWPSVLLWLAMPVYVLHCHREYAAKHEPKLQSLSVLCKVKVAFCMLTWLVSMTNTGWRIYVSLCDSCTGLEGAYTFVTSILQALTFGMVARLTRYLYQRGIHSSGLLFLYWLTLSLTGTISITSDILRPYYKLYEEALFNFCTTAINYVLVVIQFILTLIPDPDVVHHTVDDVSEPLLVKDSDTLSHSGKWDEEDYSLKESCPEENATFLSKMTFFWLTKLLIRGFKQKTLTFDDLPDIHGADKCSHVVPKIQHHWQDYLNAHRLPGAGQLLRALLWTAKGPLLIAMTLRLVICFSTFMNPILLQVLISWVSSDDPYRWKGYALCVILLTSNVFNSVTTHLFFKFAAVTAMRVRTAITAMVFRKVLRLSVGARQGISVGGIVNIMSVDAQKVQDTINDMHEIWAAPVMVALAIYYLWTLLGPSCLAGLAFIILLAPINGGFLVRKFAGLQEIQMKNKDERIRLITEILSSIKVLKMYAWEVVFSDRVTQARQEELRTVRVQAYIQASVGMIWYCTPFLVSLCVFTVYVLSSPDNFLDPQKAFVSVNLFNTLNWSTSFIPIFLALAAQAYISLQRICKLLLENELDKDAIVLPVNTQEAAISLKNASFSWADGKDSRPTLNNITVSFADGKLTAIVGPVGSGKTSLVAAILGEMTKVQGQVYVTGSMAYVPQEPWIQNMTVQENILFGRALDVSRYDTVLSACALGPDLNQLPAGDQTEIGEKGINLSGGQRQRVNLARAVYQNCDVIIMDDTLSAVDAHVGRHIFDHVIGPHGVLRQKTRVLVTHNVALLNGADNIIVLEGGSVAETGTYEQLVKKAGIFARLLGDTHISCFSSDKPGERDSAVSDGTENNTCSHPGGAKNNRRRRRRSVERQRWSHQKDRRTVSQHERAASLKTRYKSLKHDVQRKIRAAYCDYTDPLKKQQQKQASVETSKMSSITESSQENEDLISEESTGHGNISWADLKVYLSSGGKLACACVVLSELLYVASLTATNIWLSVWSDDPYVDQVTAQRQTRYRLAVYSVLGIGQMLSVGVLSLAVYLGCLQASSSLHSSLLARILRAPLVFFHATPLGRIVNRFSTDIDKLDCSIPTFTRLWLLNVAAVLSTIIIITYSTVYFLAVAIPIFIIYVIIQRVYIVSIRQLKRIDSVRRSPIYVHFNETLVGVSCVRAYGREEQFIAQCDRLIDDSNVAWYPILIGQRWLGFYLDLLGSLVVFFAALFAVLQPSGDSSAGLAGLAVSFAMQISWSINMMVRGSSELETHVISVERIVEYTRLPQEPSWTLEDHRPPSGWPSSGKVEFRRYSATYRPGLEPALRQISLEVTSGEKLAVVGRTGAGKSSLTLSMFRLIDRTEGALYLDGVDVSAIGLHDLRSRISIIPQEPSIFKGSLHWNLDPSGQCELSDIWRALDKVHLYKFVRCQPHGLEYDCGEGGQNLSLGQRQLVCLARALLRNSRVLVLDEVTASVDPETDAFIQLMLRTQLRDCTVITIAHRISTVRDYDRVCVMDDGRIVELDTPSNLLQDENSLFRKLAQESESHRVT